MLKWPSAPEAVARGQPTVGLGAGLHGHNPSGSAGAAQVLFQLSPGRVRHPHFAFARNWLPDPGQGGVDPVAQPIAQGML